jgi:hypothetical protein
MSSKAAAAPWGPPAAVYFMQPQPRCAPVGPYTPWEAQSIV